MTPPLIADTGGPDGDGLTLCDVLAALGWPPPKIGRASCRVRV